MDGERATLAGWVATQLGLVDKLGRTPLHHSARLGYGAASKLLVDRGSVVTTEDNHGRTARDMAKERVLSMQ